MAAGAMNTTTMEGLEGSREDDGGDRGAAVVKELIHEETYSHRVADR